jgi:hypothetical protein
MHGHKMCLGIKMVPYEKIVVATISATMVLHKR